MSRCLHRHAAFPALAATAAPNRPADLAATDSFDSVSPEPAISWMAERMRSTSACRGLTQPPPRRRRQRRFLARCRPWPRSAAVRHRQSNRARGRAPGDRNNPTPRWYRQRRRRDRAGRKPRSRNNGRHLADRLPGAVRHQHDIGRGFEHRQAGDAACQRLRHAHPGQGAGARGQRALACFDSAVSSAASTCAMPSL